MLEKSTQTNLYLIRHGRTDWNAAGRLQGSIERDLDEVGIQQAEEVAHSLSKETFDAIYSSSMRRAQQTAQIIARPHQLDVFVEHALREGSYGTLDGMLREQFHARFSSALALRRKMSFQERFHHRLEEGIETAAEIIERVVPCLRRLCQVHPGQKLIVVTHGWVIKTLMAYLANCDDSQIDIPNCSVLPMQGNGQSLFIRTGEGICNTP